MPQIPLKTAISLDSLPLDVFVSDEPLRGHHTTTRNERVVLSSFSEEDPEDVLSTLSIK